MSLFSRKKSDVPVREYDSWDPAALAARNAAAEDAAEAAGEESPAKSSRSRTGAEHLKAATDALDAQAKRDT